jgi:hypothetical protein
MREWERSVRQGLTAEDVRLSEIQLRDLATGGKIEASVSGGEERRPQLARRVMGTVGSEVGDWCFGRHTALGCSSLSVESP